jgi:outer membrane lipoprotein-sorting protein
MRNLLVFILAVALGLPLAARAGSGDSAEQTLRTVVESSRGIARLEASFTQVKQLQAFREPATSTGRLTYERGGAVVWSYTAPVRMDFVLEGSRARTIYPDLGEEQEFDLDTDARIRPMVESMFVWLGGDPAVVAEAYEIAHAADVPGGVELRPRSEMIRGMLQRIVLRFDEAHQVTEIRMDEPDGDSTVISFVYERVERAATP